MSRKSFIVFVVAFVVIFLIIVIFVKSAFSAISLNKLNNMYKDIGNLEDKIALYYLDYGFLPIKKENEIDFKFKGSNANDNENYYEIDLEKIGNINIYYGKKLKDEKDLYIVNEQSHTVYYYKGVKYKGETYYTPNLEYEKVNLEQYQ